jgi:hypothetical protein
VEHDIIGTRYAHDVGTARRRQQRQQHIHVVLIRLGVIGIADVAPHRQPSSLPQK